MPVVFTISCNTGTSVFRSMLSVPVFVELELDQSNESHHRVCAGETKLQLQFCGGIYIQSCSLVNMKRLLFSGTKSVLSDV